MNALNGIVPLGNLHIEKGGPEIDKKFKEMLREAEKIRAECRRTGNIGPHARHMQKMVEYEQKKGLLTGNVPDDSASAEFLAHSAEMAACVLEVIHNEKVGSVFHLLRKQQRELAIRAKEKAIAHLRAGEAAGILPEDINLDDLEEDEEEWMDWTTPVIPVIRGRQGSVVSVHVGKHCFGEVDELGQELTRRLKHRERLTREEVKNLYKKYFPTLPEESPIPDFVELQPGVLLGLYRKAFKISASCFLPYNDGGGYVDLVAIRDKVTEREVRLSVFPNCGDDEKNADMSSDAVDKEFSFGPRWRSCIL